MMASGNGAGGSKSHFDRYREGHATPEIQLTIGLVLTGRRWRSLLDEALRPTGQSSARMEAMAAIASSPKPRPQVDIAKRLKIEGPTLTRMLDSLEKDGLVERLPDPADRRTKQLRLTEEGEEVLREIFEMADELRSRLLDEFSDDEIAQMNVLTSKLMRRLDTGLPERE